VRTELVYEDLLRTPDHDQHRSKRVVKQKLRSVALEYVVCIT